LEIDSVGCVLFVMIEMLKKVIVEGTSSIVDISVGFGLLDVLLML
jgi:hypothetical protein